MRAASYTLVGAVFIVSGILSAISRYYSLILYGFAPLVPGLIFGMAVLLCFRSRLSTIGAVKFTSISIFAHYAAFMVAGFTSIALSDHSLSLERQLQYLSLSPGIIAGGLVGGLALLFAVHILLFSLNKKEFISLTLLSGLLSILGWAAGSSLGSAVQQSVDNDLLGHYGLYILWQFGMGVALWWLVDKHNRENIEQLGSKKPS